MAVRKKTKSKAEFGDFQTPPALTEQVCALLVDHGLHPSSVLEPTCGTGSFLAAAVRAFPAARQIVGMEINPQYVAQAESLLNGARSDAHVHIQQADFFQTDWEELIRDLPKPLLVLGNPPWVTSAELGSLGSSNLPEKSNFQGHSGIEALMGKSNFDISEWMLLRALEWIEGQDATLAILCKVAVARKVLLHAWKHGHRCCGAEVHRIRALEHFGASVDACLFVVSGHPHRTETECSVYDSVGQAYPTSCFGFRDGQLVADLQRYDEWKHLAGPQRYRWRSGVKHDCSKVMELRRCGPSSYINGLGEEVELEPNSLFPMLKSSELANGAVLEPTRCMIVTQSAPGEPTSHIESQAPLTWQYLCAHGDRLDSRGSTIYKKRPRFFCVRSREVHFHTLASRHFRLLQEARLQSCRLVRKKADRTGRHLLLRSMWIEG